MGQTSSNLPENPVENTAPETTQAPSEFKKLTAAEIISILKEKKVSGNEFGHGDFDSEELGLGKSEEVHNDREGSDYDCAVKVEYFVDHGVYISVSGYYSSQEGADFDGDFNEVKPVEKTVIDYVSVNEN